MFARVNSFGVQGLSGFAVTAEADISGGLPQFSIVGLPDSAVKEAADRVRSAAKNLGFAWPASRITVNLALRGCAKQGRCMTCRCFWPFCVPAASCPRWTNASPLWASFR